MATINLPRDFREFLKLFNIQAVDHLLKVNKAASGRYKDLNDLEHLSD
jgi:hypothetical protein